MDLTNNDLNQHISSAFNEELASLRTHVLAMAGLVERNLQSAVQGLREMDSSVLGSLEECEKQINAYEILIDREVLNIIALRQPAASDLRVVMAISKIVRDLERMGDEVYKVGDLAAQLSADQPPAAALDLAISMGTQVASSVKNSIDSFVRLDVDAARDVFVEDKEIDSDYESSLRAMVTFMIEDPRNIGRIVKLQWIFRSLERVGDHATNISEQLIYAVQGTDIRHGEVTQNDLHKIGKL